MKLFRSRTAVAIFAVVAIIGGYFGGSALLQQVEFARAAGDVEATREQLSTVQDLSTVFRHVGKVVEPSVVNITVRKTVHANNNAEPFRRFFRGQPGAPQAG